MGKAEIERLGMLLAQNHVLSSIDKQTLMVGNNWKKILNNKSKEELRTRTVAVIVGAGASTQANMPLGTTTIKNLKNQFRINEEAFEYVLRELESVYEYDRTTFETNLLALNRFRPNRLLDDIQKIYLHKYYPLFCYEILSHLLKHRFVDVIINFNFDEFLDQSIEDELGIGEYYKIISDGDCPEHLLYKDPTSTDNEKPDLPIYIKPHGTASHKSTLRFTRADYFRLPTDIKNLLKNLLIKPNIPLVLISIGFNMQSFEFNEIIRKPPAKSEIFYINLCEPFIKSPLENYKKNLIEVSEQKGKNDLDAVIKKLWESTSNTFTKNYKPRSIDRHNILKSVFKKYENFDQDPSPKKHFNINYFLNRTIIEFLIYAAKSKGLINLSHAATSRCGTYYDLYQRKMGNSTKTKSFIEILDNFDFSETEYGFELFQLKDTSGSEKSDAQTNLIVGPKHFEAWIKHIMPLIHEISRKVSPKTEMDAETKKELFTSFYNLYGPEETEIRVSKNNLYNKIFVSPVPLQTKTSLKYKTLSLFKENWNQLLIVAETGQWLLMDSEIVRLVELRNQELQKSGGQAGLYLIVADKSFETRLKNEFSFCDFHYSNLNWWEHNRHFTIALDAGRPLSCIYFSRRLRSQNVTPLYLGSKDAQKVLGIFCMYLEKTKNNNVRIVDYSKINDAKLYINGLFKSK